MFLKIVDYFSKWLEVIPVNNTNSKSMIKALQHYFTTHRYPQVTISDNGSVFTSEELTFFVKTNGMKHIKSALSHLATNMCRKSSKDIQNSNEKAERYRIHV